MFIKTTNGWIHKTRLKVTINPVLRFIQFWTNKPFVIISNCEFKNNMPIFLNYSFERYPYNPDLK